KEDPALTASGRALGSPVYMSPEQVRSHRDQIGPAADVYGLGTILYFLLTGQPPFQGESATAVLSQVLLEKPTRPRQVNPQAPEELEAVCLKCLEKDPARRYPSAAALAAALRAASAALGLEVGQRSRPARPPSSPSLTLQDSQCGTLQPSGRPAAPADGRTPAWRSKPSGRV